MMKKTRRLRQEFLKTMIALATSGFGLVAALAWNDTIQSFIKRVVPENGSDIISKFFYALVVTSIAVFVTYSLGNMLQREMEKQERAEEADKKDAKK